MLFGKYYLKDMLNGVYFRVAGKRGNRRRFHETNREHFRLFALHDLPWESRGKLVSLLF